MAAKKRAVKPALKPPPAPPDPPATRSPWELPREGFTEQMRSRAPMASNTKEGQRINGLGGLK